MTDQHPITPPPELVAQWRKLPEYTSQLRMMSTVTLTTEKLQDIATQAARWGADQQLTEDAKWLDRHALDAPHLKITPVGESLIEAMRPKPPSLKEQALAQLDAIQLDLDSSNIYGANTDTIRKALETIND